MSMSCVRGDLMKEYFVARHLDVLNKKLQSKLGEYAEIVVNTVEDENGGDIELSLGVYDLKEELVNFSQDVAERINKDKDYEYEDLTKEEIERAINQFLKINNLNIDIDWEEHSQIINLFYNDSYYTNIDIYDEMQRYNYIILDELYYTVIDFINNTINQAIKDFNEAWVYEYSSYEEDDLN